MTKTLGRVLIVAGVAVWGVYGLVWLFDGEPAARVYLPFHLGGVIPGSVLSRWEAVRAWMQRRRDRRSSAA